MTSNLCPFCGAASPRHCDLREETGGECPWELALDAQDDERSKDNDDAEEDIDL